MFLRLIVIAIGLAAGLTVSSSASATVSGWTTRSVNMRTCASTRCARILVIPARARIAVFHCSRWCSVHFAGRRGFVSARYVVINGYRTVPPPVYILPPPLYRVPPPYYRWRYRDPRYRWHPPYQRWPGHPRYGWGPPYNSPEYRLYEGK